MVDLVPAASAAPEILAELDWTRAITPVMAGPVARRIAANRGTYLVQSRATSEVVGVLDALTLGGYADVTSVSIYTDTSRAHGGWALEAYGRLVMALFEQGTRLVHHEVLEFNRPVHRILQAMGIEATARLRDHAYVAGRFWDVLLYSYDRAAFDAVLNERFPRTGEHVASGSPEAVAEPVAE